MSLLERLREAGALRRVDLALADTLRRHAPATPEPVLAAAALASAAIAEGHAGCDLRAAPEADADWPPPAAWETQLVASPWVATPAADAEADPTRPLVLEAGLLYLRRYREHERRLAQDLRRIAAAGEGTAPAAALAPLFAALFPHAHEDDAQARAAALALRRRLLLITGGPGTGKTTTVARLLLLLVAQARLEGAPAPRIALAAPTGRAARRLAESLQRGLAGLRALPGVAPELCAAVPAGAQTLHRLLGLRPDRPQARYHATQRLPCDVVVVDEASMVDLPLMARLAEAVATGARLVLLGDPEQLPSVEAGDVLAAICAAAGAGDALADADARALAPLLGAAAVAPETAAPLAGHRVHLRRGYRQAESLELAPLAEAVRTGEADAALALLRAGGLSGVRFHEDVHDPLAGPLREALLAPWRALAQARDPDSALALAARQCLLTALRDGAARLNARIEEALAGPRRAPYFHGRLLLVTENDHRQGLFNGDIGVCLHEASGGTRVWFAGEDGTPRAFHPAALPAHASAFALTVHKAQGSEFDTVWLLLPRQDARVLSRELVYTALTRARRALHLCGDADALGAALARRAQRVSGLAWRLGATAAA
ncbi:exodeoxyribonuclease V subunit alpha [Vulcaniibacterium gelatinicum]|uniref:exodeoxyribonuclease V subunit alpha n=1 Tax=Vulcaniibacterium gelatinicum TaxID=2598725 RepID=UPI0011CCC198|nr:exodeoxyribonuclease V subunit alpha [Vulcaniibacterium gelatinicum]